MKGNQGLEALAALCGGATQVPTTGNQSLMKTSCIFSTIANAEEIGSNHHNTTVNNLRLVDNVNSRVGEKNKNVPTVTAHLSTCGPPQVLGSILNTQHPAVSSAFEPFGGATPTKTVSSIPSSNTDSQLLIQNLMSAVSNRGDMMNTLNTTYPQVAAAALSNCVPSSMDASTNLNAVQQLALYHYYQTQAAQAAQLIQRMGQKRRVLVDVDKNAAGSNSIDVLRTKVGQVAKHVNSHSIKTSQLPRPTPLPSSQTHTCSPSSPTIASNSSSPLPNMPPDQKKKLKRAANRRSAQLSRKRKKQFIEELKEENEGLRRKEAILRSIPDLVVLFDSSGKLWFVSDSVNRFLNYTAEELEGSSFWERLCGESVLLLKTAFMDALAAFKPGKMDTAPLGNGLWQLRLIDRDGITQKLVTLNGVVHFSGDTPECVCSIRPIEKVMRITSKRKTIPNTRPSCTTHLARHVENICTTIKPQQNIVVNTNNVEPGNVTSTVMLSNDKSSFAIVKKEGATISRLLPQISDGESVLSETGSYQS